MKPQRIDLGWLTESIDEYRRRIGRGSPWISIDHSDNHSGDHSEMDEGSVGFLFKLE